MLFSFGGIFFSLLSNVTNKLHISSPSIVQQYFQFTTWTSDGVNAICNGHG